LLSDQAKPVSVEDALRRFRENDRSVKDLEGVYLYATTGGESLDVLGGARHRYPATTTLTALRIPCGLQLDWAALRGRTDSWTLCSTAAGVELRIADERHRFFGQSDRTTYACEGDVLVPAGSGAFPTAGRPYGCRTRHGAERGVARTIGREAVTVGGSSVVAVHARNVSTVSGVNHGAETVDWWLDAGTALPLRIVLQSRTSRDTFIGVAHYREDADLHLVSTTPRQ
jgi:hypothetical protein